MTHSAQKQGHSLMQNPLYPEFDSVADAEAFALSRTPVQSANEMCGLLQSFKNTLLKQLDQLQSLGKKPNT